MDGWSPKASMLASGEADRIWSAMLRAQLREAGWQDPAAAPFWARAAYELFVEALQRGPATPYRARHIARATIQAARDAHSRAASMAAYVRPATPAARVPTAQDRRRARRAAERSAARFETAQAERFATHGRAVETHRRPSVEIDPLALIGRPAFPVPPRSMAGRFADLPAARAPRVGALPAAPTGCSVETGQSCGQGLCRIRGAVLWSARARVARSTALAVADMADAFRAALARL